MIWIWRAQVNQLGAANARTVRVGGRDHAALVTCFVTPAAYSSVNYYFNLAVMRTALEARTAYVDLGELFHATRLQWELHGAFAAARTTTVAGMGDTPGITNVQVRYGVDRPDTAAAVKCYDGLSVAPMDGIG